MWPNLQTRLRHSHWPRLAATQTQSLTSPQITHPAPWHKTTTCRWKNTSSPWQQSCSCLPVAYWCTDVKRTCFEFCATKWICSMEKLSRENRKSLVSLVPVRADWLLEGNVVDKAPTSLISLLFFNFMPQNFDILTRVSRCIISVPIGWLNSFMKI